ncbi:hypothetical protein [Tsukamurella soli]|uniref:hypothetical protein n=1 Tax=Tsukamurella soli TaxID=644556 RepID=UPI00360B3F0F
MRKLVYAAATAAMMAGTAVLPATAEATPLAITYAHDCGQELLRPTRLVLTCADAGSVVVGITWSFWNTEAAVGHGTWIRNPCQPYCAVDPQSTWPGTSVRVALSDKQGNEFEDMVLSDASGHAIVWPFLT